MSFPARRRSLLVALILCASAAAGCTDLPTGADTFQLEADGLLWTAIMPPADLPTAASWLSYADAGAATEAAVARITELEREARLTRATGDLARADEITAEAVRTAVGVMNASGRTAMIRGLLGLDAWQRAVKEEVDLQRSPELAAAVESVERERAAAELALSEGLDAEAAVRLTLAAERARSWGPEGVALRVLERVETRLEELGEEDEGSRARHLVHSARQELAAGESLRAVQRALYALQIADGNALSEPGDDERPRCGEYAC